MKVSAATGLKAAAGGLWLIALFLPALTPTDEARNGYGGFGALLMGWLGVFEGMFAWLANPLMGLAAMAGRRWSPGLALAGLALALSSLHNPQVCWDDRCHPARLGAGGWLWIASAAVLLASALLRLRAPLSPHRHG